MVDGIWCKSPKFKTQIIKTVASMYVSAVGKRVSGNSAGQDDNSQCICDKLYYGHALRVRHRKWYLVLSPKFKTQIIKTVASMYISAAGKRVSGNSAGQNDNSQCICDKLYCGHA